HQSADLYCRPGPVLRGEGKQGQVFDAQLPGLFDDHVHRLGAPLMADDALEHALLRPAAVSVHDDRQVNGKFVRVKRSHQTSITSFSLWVTASSTLASKLLVTSWTSFSNFFSSSSVMLFSFSSFFSRSMASRRMLRRAILSS